LAYHRSPDAWHNKGIPAGDYQRTISGNFLDISVIEWLKIFGNDKEKHHWKKLVSRENDFRTGLLGELSLTRKEFKVVWKNCATYRNHFIAHLDSSNVLQIPQMDIPLKAARFLYSELKIFNNPAIFVNLPSTLDSYYRECLAEASARSLILSSTQNR